MIILSLRAFQRNLKHFSIRILGQIMYLIFEQYKQCCNLFDIYVPNFNYVLAFLKISLAFLETTHENIPKSIRPTKRIEKYWLKLPKIQNATVECPTVLLPSPNKYKSISWANKVLSFKRMGLQQGARLVPGQDSYLPCLHVWDSSFQQASPTHP